MSTIKLNNLTKIVQGKYILNNVNYVFEESKIYVIYGKNGEGKSTLLKSILGLTKISNGKVVINNEEISVPYKKKLRKHFFYMPDTPVFLDYLTGYENLLYISELYKSKKSKETIEKVLYKYDLYKDRNNLYGNYSKGMKQKLNFSVKELSNFDIWIMDEPTDGVDKYMINKMKEEICDEKNGKIVIITTHDFDFGNTIADYTLVLENGELKNYSIT